MRKRYINICTRYSDDEYAILKNNVKNSGLSLQKYMNTASLGAKVTTKEEIELLKDSNISSADIDRQLKGMATNINQMAHVANGQGLTPTIKKLEEIYAEIISMKREVNELWQSTRSLIGGQIHMPR